MVLLFGKLKIKKTESHLMENENEEIVPSTVKSESAAEDLVSK